MMDLSQESNKFLPLSKLSPSLNERILKFPILRQQCLYDNRQRIRDLFFKLLRIYNGHSDVGMGKAGTSKPNAMKVSGHGSNSWETSVRLAFLELRRECKEENIEYCLDLFFTNATEMAFTHYFPKVSFSFAESLEVDPAACATSRALDPSDLFIAPPSVVNEEFPSLELLNISLSGLSVPHAKLPYNKLTKLEKRFTDKPASPFKGRLKPPDPFSNPSFSPLALACANYTLFISCISPSFSSVPITHLLKLTLEFLLVIDSYQFTRNAALILKQKIIQSRLELSSVLKGEGLAGIQHSDDIVKKKYLEFLVQGHIYGFVIALEIYNADKYCQNYDLDKDLLVCTCEDAVDQILYWTLLDSCLTFMSPFLSRYAIKTEWIARLSECSLDIVRASICSKLQTRDITQANEEKSLLNAAILEIIDKIYTLSLLSEGSGVKIQPPSDNAKKTIRPIPLLFIPVCSCSPTAFISLTVF